MSYLNRLLATIVQNNWIVLDTETTGLGARDEIIQIAVIDMDGRTLVDTFLKPSKPIPAEATRIHGIINQDVIYAPTMADVNVQRAILSAIRGRDVVIYNASYDQRLLYQTGWAHHLKFDWRKIGRSWTCAMLAYAEHYGEWNPRYRNFKWQKLSLACQQQGIPVENAHAALAECQMT
jgi:DNA polymerase III subunit epsilon